MEGAEGANCSNMPEATYAGIDTGGMHDACGESWKCPSAPSGPLREPVARF